VRHNIDVEVDDLRSDDQADGWKWNHHHEKSELKDVVVTHFREWIKSDE
jgi:hypothetical protein